ncbi:hypothetical protein GQ54DRAFT_297473 [Martensiomyces pterosporus]|nr:hypothetical protein GQ54DRAFT_297473 [Martensiomyces pterosporus]
MEPQITQVDGCTFTTAELQQFHKYYKFDWQAAGLGSASVSARIEHFTTQTDVSTDAQRLRDWLRTMNITDDSEKSDEEKLYDRFEQYDFTTAPGFNELLSEVYATNNVSKYELDGRMEQAKARYYSEKVEHLDYRRYNEFKEANRPKPVCPYQHLWDTGADNRPANTRNFANVKLVDLADFLDAAPSSVLSAEIIGRIHEDVVEAYSERYFAIAIVRGDCQAEIDSEPVFLPSLDTENRSKALRALIKLQIELRKLNRTKPVVIFASGSVDPSAVGLLLSTAELITTELFSITPGPAHKSAAQFPVPALFDWAHLSDQGRVDAGTAEYLLCHPELVLRSSEWAALGLSHGFVAHRNLDKATERILMAASCPPPHTRDALRKSYVVESAYPGPSKVSVWRREIEQFFRPLAEGSATIEGLVDELNKVDKPWAKKYLAFTAKSSTKDLAKLRVAALRTARSLELSQALALEYSATDSWSKGEASVDKLLAATTPISAVLAEEQPDAAADALKANPLEVEIPGECPFAQMYRKNPDRFKHVDLQAIASHRPLQL